MAEVNQYLSTSTHINVGPSLSDFICRKQKPLGRAQYSHSEGTKRFEELGKRSIKSQIGRYIFFLGWED